jgi:hypothetical protein
MSRRYECGYARSTEIGVLTGEDAADDQVLDVAEIAIGQRALIIGDPYGCAYAVCGTPAELRQFVTRLRTHVDGLEPQ